MNGSSSISIPRKIGDIASSSPSTLGSFPKVQFFEMSIPLIDSVSLVFSLYDSFLGSPRPGYSIDQPSTPLLSDGFFIA